MPETFHTPLLMRPVFSPRPWGGRRLESALGKVLPAREPIGESWELSDHPNGRSLIASGVFAGTEFGELVREHPVEMIGRAAAPERFPLLVKFIDAAEDLSIQVHPSDDNAPNGDRGKTECWYIIDAKPGTQVIYGLNRGVTPEMLRRGAEDGSIKQMVASLPLHAGDFLFVPAGTVHAILGGTLVCEIQQASDTTYRLWDWNRQPARQLHIEQSLAVINWSAEPLRPLATPPLGKIAEPLTLTDNSYFRVRAVDLLPGSTTRLPRAETGLIVVCVAGEVSLSGPGGSIPLLGGSTAFVPAACGFGEVTAGGRAVRLLLADSAEI